MKRIHKSIITKFILNLHSYGSQELIVPRGKVLQVVQDKLISFLIYNKLETNSEELQEKKVLTIFNLSIGEEIPVKYDVSMQGANSIEYINSTQYDGVTYNWFYTFN